ncbi:hypothetical protein LTR41_002008 [Exophiala xenobiotica]|nr:hypothetical protein LTR41_002008 [Exophiala xenobiotica]
MTSVPPHRGAALCYDEARRDLYKNACLTDLLLNTDNWSTSGPPYFICLGWDIGDLFVPRLRAGGENGCVCRYNLDADDNWDFVQAYGHCNGACIADAFTCDGSLPVPAEGTKSKQKRSSPPMHIAAEKRTSMAAPVSVPWKAAAVVATVFFCQLML